MTRALPLFCLACLLTGAHASVAQQLQPPNAQVPPPVSSMHHWRRRGPVSIKSVLEIVLQLPAPLIEAACRRLYAWHLRRRSSSWRSPDQVRLQSDYLKLHTQSHRHTVLDRFEAAVEEAVQRADYETVPRAIAAGQRRAGR